MKNQKLLFLVIIASIGISQLAATVHAVGHLHAPVHHAAVNHHYAEFTGPSLTHPTHAHPAHSESHGATMLREGVAPKSDDSLTEHCSLYHLYLTLQGCAYAPHASAEVSTPETEVPVSRTEGMTVSAVNLTHIRGPPVSA